MPGMQMQTRAFTHALILAIVAIAAVDLGLRVFEPRLSGDIANTMSFPERVAELSSTDGKRVAAIGNSLIGDGLDTDVFMGKLLDPNPGKGHAIKMVPDGSGIWDWHCLVHHRLADMPEGPDLVVIGFGWDQLSDQNRISLTRSFNALCPAGALRDFSVLSGRIGINDWLEMATVKTSKLYAHRQTIRHRVLQNVVPDYRRMTRQLNARAGDAGDTETPTRSVEFSYRALDTMLDRLSGSGSQVVLVAMPVMTPYEIDKGICEHLAGTQHRLLDMRFAVPSQQDLYRDNLHLNESGSRLFSEALALQLREKQPSMSACRI
jgi:hypothetical protein